MAVRSQAPKPLKWSETEIAEPQTADDGLEHEHQERREYDVDKSERESPPQADAIE